MIDWTYGFVIASVASTTIVGISKGGFGGGLAMVGVPILSLAVDPRTAAAISLPVLVAMDAYNIWLYRTGWSAADMPILILGGLTGILIGALTFHMVSEPAMRLIVGSTALVFLLDRFLKRRAIITQPRPPSWTKGSAWGAIAGFTSFTAHAGVPPLAMYLLPRGLTKQMFQSTNVFFFGITNVVKVIPYALLGQFTQPTLIASAALLPVAAGSIFLGFWLNKRVSETLFFQLCIAFLGLAGIKLVYDGLEGLGVLPF